MKKKNRSSFIKLVPYDGYDNSLPLLLYIVQTNVSSKWMFIVRLINEFETNTQSLIMFIIKALLLTKYYICSLFTLIIDKLIKIH